MTTTSRPIAENAEVVTLPGGIEFVWRVGGVEIVNLGAMAPRGTRIWIPGVFAEEVANELLRGAERRA